MIVIAFWLWPFGWNECVLGSRWHLTVQNLTPRDIRKSSTQKAPSDRKCFTNSSQWHFWEPFPVTFILQFSRGSNRLVSRGPDNPWSSCLWELASERNPCIPTEEYFLLKPQKEPPLPLLVGRSWYRVRGQLFVITFCFFTRSFCTSVARSPWKGSQKEAPFPHIPLCPDSEIIRHTHLPLHFLPAQFKSTVSCCSFD